MLRDKKVKTEIFVEKCRSRIRFRDFNSQHSNWNEINGDFAMFFFTLPRMKELYHITFIPFSRFSIHFRIFFFKYIVACDKMNYSTIISIRLCSPKPSPQLQRQENQKYLQKKFRSLSYVNQNLLFIDVSVILEFQKKISH